jgi:hypothetical protein
MDKINLNTSEKNLILFFGSKTTIYLSSGLHKGCQRYRRSLQPFQSEHLALQNMKFLNFFLLLWVIFALLDPDPDSEPEIGYGSTDLIESGYNPDPDPNTISRTRTLSAS